MPAFKQKNVIKSFKGRMLKKVQSITEETQDVIGLLGEIISKFKEKAQLLTEVDDDSFFARYHKLNQDLENYREKLFFVQATVDSATEEDAEPVSDCNVENVIQNRLEQPQSDCSSVANLVESNQTVCVSKKLCQEVTQEIESQTSPSALQDPEKLSLETCQIVSKYPYASSQNDTDVCKTSIDHEHVENNLTPDILPVNKTISSTSQRSDSQDSYYRSLSSHSNDPIFHASDDSAVNFSKSVVIYDEPPCVQGKLSNLNVDKFSNAFDQVVYETSAKRIHDVIVSPHIAIPSDIYAIVTHVIDPGNFWMQLESQDFQELCIYPACDYTNEVPTSMLMEGDFCLAPFKSTGFFYRAKILTIQNPALDVSSCTNGKIANVFFIDNGLTEKLPLCQLKLLPKAAYKTPMLAIHCYLAGVSPVNETWSTESVQKFKEFQAHDNVKTHVVSRDDDIYGVELTVTVLLLEENLTCDIAQMLYLNGFAIDLKKCQSASKKKLTNYNLQSASALEQIYDYSAKSEQTEREHIFSTVENRISCDSGVSVTSLHRISTSQQDRNYDIELDNKILSGDIAITQDSLDAFEDDQSNNFEYSEIEISKCGSNQNVKNCIQTQTKKSERDLMKFDSFEEDAWCENSLIDELKRVDVYPNNEISKVSEETCFPDRPSWNLTVPLPSVTFVEKDMMLVMMAKVVNPNEFYVNLAIEDSITLDELHEQLNVFCESIRHSNEYGLEVKFLHENMFCAGHFEEDGNWYRVKILQIDLPQKQVEVQYIDYGNKAMITFDNLCPISPEFAKYPTFAIKCSLAYVIPKHTDVAGFDMTKCQSEQLKTWCDDAIEAFKKLASFDKCLTAQVVGEFNSNASEPLQVLLWDTQGSADVLINEALVADNVAEFASEIVSEISKNESQDPKSPEISVLNQWDPMAEDFNSIENSYGVDATDLEIATLGYKARDEKYICKYFSRTRFCPRGDSCEYQHIYSRDSGVTRDQEDTYSLYCVPELPEASTFVLLKVSAIIDPGHFYAVFPYGSKTVDQIDAMVNNGASIKDLVNLEPKFLISAMSKYYSNSPFNENTTIAPACGNIVAAKSTSDGLWYRARVITVQDVAKPAKVFFVDFGYLEWVPRKFIHEILPEFLHTPFQAVECFLCDVEPKEREKGLSWTEKSRNEFQQIVKNRILLAQIVHRSETLLHLRLKNTMPNDHRMISQFLVDEGYAQFTTSERNLVKTETLKKGVSYIPG